MGDQLRGRPSCRPRVWRAVQIATWAVVGLSILALAILLMNRAMLAFPVEGFSMLPVLHGGDLAFVLPTSVQGAQLGDIVVYRSPIGIYVIHRVVSKGSGYLIVKGDNNPSPDPWNVTNSMLAGRVVLIVDYLGYLIEPPQTYVLAAALALLIALSLFRPRSC